MTAKLQHYLQLEEALVTLGVNHPVASYISDTMNAVWYNLTAEDQEWVNQRGLDTAPKKS